MKFYFEVEFHRTDLEIFGGILEIEKLHLIAKEKQGPVVQSIVSLTSSLRGQLVECFTT